MNDAWLQAMLVYPPRICGRRLLPYSLAHMRILSGLQSPYVFGISGDRHELLTAIAVCSRTMAENRTWFFGGSRLTWLRERLWSLRYAVSDLRLADQSLRQHIANHSARPMRVSSRAKGGHPINGDWSWHCVRMLCREWGKTFDAAWETPLGVALCCWDISQEAEGDTGLLSEYDALLAELSDAREKALAAEDTEAAEALWEQIEVLAKSHREAEAEHGSSG